MKDTSHAQLLRESLTAIDRLERRLEQSEAAKHEPIAIVGAGCRYPGSVETPERLWQNLRDGVDAVRDVPADRWDADAYYSADRQAPGKMITRRGGFLSQVDRFEPQLFGISPREAATMDPQQRFLLETAYEALEDAAVATDRLAGSATGVFVGITTGDYGQLLRQLGPETSDVYAATGSALNAAAGRVSFTFGLQGPCVAVDTACSSSLVAVHLACQSLRAGECNLALAGGVNVVLLPDAMVLFSKWGMLAPDGHCKTFDASADGFVRGEGCAVVALRRLSDALAAGDPILAVIRGSAVNSDGRSSGLTVPSGPAQRQVLQSALANAKLEASDIDYVEAHGTGTPLGDPIEVEALGAVLGRGHSAERPLLIGSVKTGLGHTEAASGVAGMLKVVMALKHEAIPPHLHFSQPNRGIPWERLPLKVATELTPWPRGQRVRRAGVSSFGFSGTNAHVIVEEAPALVPPPAPNECWTLVPLSAREDKGLRALAERLADFVAADPATSLADIARTLATGRAHQAERVALTVDSKASLVTELQAVAAGVPPAAGVAGRVRAGERFKVAFVFTGQGAQYAGMGRGLYEREPVFRDALERAAAILAQRLDKPLLELLFDTQGKTLLSQTAYTQPALFALEYALTELWTAWGITPAVVLGHSVGEYVAATIAGAMTLEEGLTLIAERGRLMQALPAGGSMAAVFANAAEVSRRVEQSQGRVSIAAFNGPEETVVSGDAPAVAELLAAAARDGIESRPLDVSHAFHSHRLDPMLDALERSAGIVHFVAPRVTLISNLTGAPFAAHSAPDAAYFRRHAREPVNFSASIAALRAAGVNALVEIGPHPTLLGLVARSAPGASWFTAASLRRGRDDAREMLGAAGALYTRGAPVAWDAVGRAGGGRRVRLPTYPFQRERHWFAASSRATSRTLHEHPLLGLRRNLASAPATHTWETTLSLESHPWLTDHRVQGEAIVPATAFIEIALAAGAEVLGHAAGHALRLEDIGNHKPLLLRAGDERTLQTTLTVADGGRRARLGVSSSSKGTAWVEHATAVLVKEEEPDHTSGLTLDASVRERCGQHVGGADFYETLAAAGNQWGECFQGLREVWLGLNEAVARVEPPAAVLEEAARYRFHPALSDACGHCLVAAVSSGDGSRASSIGAFVGGGVEAIRFHRPPSSTRLWAHAKLRPSAGDTRDRVVFGDVRVYDENGLVSETLGARLVYLDIAAAPASRAPRDWFYEVRWTERELPLEPASATDGTWLILADRSGVAEALAERRRAAGGGALVVEPGKGFALDGERAIVDVTDRAALRRLFDESANTSAVVHLCSLGAAAEDALTLGPESVVAVLQAMLAHASSRSPRLWLVTRDAQRARAEDTCASPFSAAVWGMGRSLSAEHAELWGGLLDLASGATPSTLAAELERELHGRDGEDQVAWRDGRRYAPRLVRRAPAERRAGVTISAEGAYLVTGGLGGIGLAAAGWLVSRGARRLLLVGRSPLPPREHWDAEGGSASADAQRIAAVRRLEASGARVETAALDVAQDGALAGWLAARRERGEPAVHGVIHAAGVLDFRPLSEHDAAALSRTLAPKIAGAWQLHGALGAEPLDWFVSCSSTSSLLRSPLLGAYAAGNAFLDSLAHYRHALGLPALSINWGTWGEVGMAADAERARGGGLLRGMSAMSTVAALSALEELLSSGAVQASVMPVDWQRLASAYPAFGRDPFLRELVGATEAPVAASPRNGAVLSALRTAEDASRPGLLLGYLREAAGRTLGMRPDELDPAVSLSSIGFDSLMAVQLKSQIEAELGVVVAMIRFLDGPSLNSILESVLDADPAKAVRAAEPAPGGWEEGSI